MVHEYLFLPAVLVFAIIQSLFGMGILVFGTPTLLLLGYDFSMVLGLLLPSSVLISFTQAYTGRSLGRGEREAINMFVCAVLVVICLSALLLSDIKINLDLLIGLVMVFSAAVRLSERFRRFISRTLVTNQHLFVLLMGAVHGLTNMGGALLALYASSTQYEKTAIRTIVSRYYLMFGVIQLGTLAILKPQSLSILGFMTAPVALLVYWVIGNLLFRRTSAPVYEILLTAFIAVYGIVVLTKGYI
ncbi:hypothetical protein BBB56_22040 [Candidatus Pantoea deserta]|uniref:Probable membrane transporter protein n=1 Tax=Candidatus Pantoea deserta TaxID=1869313 RepID=A0A3N4NFD3_9GAMM|nr:TSUP family transporter [Pantoea deserta]RPD93458.1 hypothetical protein BBB56_22040 [Pantoea deserta]